MDQPFAATKWKPTKFLETWEKEYTEEQVTELVEKLTTDTKRILLHPYDAKTWIQRAVTLGLLRYPELAAGSAHKAGLLCRSALGILETNSRPNWRLGANTGFWMRHEDPADEYDEVPPALSHELDLDLDDEHDVQIAKLNTLLSEADELVSNNLEYYPHAEVGRFWPRPYPWMKEQHRWRTEKTLDEINAEFKAATNDAPCEAKRFAFGGKTSSDGFNVIGVFATRDVTEGETVLIDRSKTWGCTGPGTADMITPNDTTEDDQVQRWSGRAANLHGGYGCSDELHPNDEDDDVVHDLRWIRDRIGVGAPHTIMNARLLLTCVQDKIDHPLDHTFIARLTPHYRAGVSQDFSLEADFDIMTEALQRFGIDVFANHHYDTWVLFTIDARSSNNAWSDAIASCMSPLFSMINHSCEPNLSWRTRVNHRTLHLLAVRPIAHGEQYLVQYDGFAHDKSLRERRAKLRKWLDRDCLCVRCAREEEAERRAAHRERLALRGGLDWIADYPGPEEEEDEEGVEGVEEEVEVVWDDAEPAELPEDGVVGGKWALLRTRADRAQAARRAARLLVGGRYE